MKKLSTYAYLLGLSICDEISLTFTVIIWLYYILPKLFKLPQDFVNAHSILLLKVYPVVASTQALSIWITLAFTLDRYLFVCHPFYGREYCTRKRAFIIIGFLYLLASIYSIPQFLERTYDTIEVLDKKFVFPSVTKIGSSKYYFYIYHAFIYCVFVSLIPLVAIVVFNGFLIYDIIKSNRRHRELSLAYQLPITKKVSDSYDKNRWFERLKPWKLFMVLCKKKPTQSQVEFDISTTMAEPCLKTTSLSTCNGTTIVNSGSNSTSVDKNFNDKSLRNDVTVMLVGLIFLFLICQSPSVILRLIAVQNLAVQWQPAYYSSLDISNFLVVTNSTLNCFLYVMLGSKFRKEFLNTFIRCRHGNNYNNDMTRTL